MPKSLAHKPRAATKHQGPFLSASRDAVVSDAFFSKPLTFRRLDHRHDIHLVLTSSPAFRRGDSCFIEPSRTAHQMQIGLTDSPQADTASPAANTLRAAFTSRSWIDPHSG